MKNWMKLAIVGALGAGSLLGCGDPVAPPLPDAVRETIFYIDPDTNARTELASPDINGLVDPPPAGTRGTAPDLSCAVPVRTTIRPPEAGTDIGLVMTVKDFEHSTPVDNVRVRFYRENQLPLAIAGDFSCTDPLYPCQEGVSAADGTLSPFMDTGASWYAYFIKGRTGPTPASTPADTAQYNEFAEATITGNSVSMSTLGIIPTVLGLTRQAGTAMVAGTLYDCTDAPVRSLVVRMFKEGPDDTITTDDTYIADAGTRTGPGYRYFDGDSFPAGDQPFTNIDGLYAAANLPVDAPIRVEAWYNAGTVAAPVPTMWGCERIRVFPNGVTIVNVRPTRSDITGCTE